MSKKTFTLEFFGKTLFVETGEIAKQADGAVLVRLEKRSFYQLLLQVMKPKMVTSSHSPLYMKKNNMRLVKFQDPS